MNVEPASIVGNDHDSIRSYARGLAPFARSFRSDPEFRGRATSEVRSLLEQHGIALPQGVQVEIIENTDELYHLVLPPDPNAILSEEDLSMVAGGTTAGTAGTLGSLSSASSVPSTVSTAGSASTASTAGTSS